MDNLRITEGQEQQEEFQDPQIQWGQLLKIMEFQEMTYPDLARLSGTPERTLRNILKGATKDPRLSTLLPIVRALGASIDRLVGLAPKRNYEREEAAYDVTLMDSMRHQVEELQQKKQADEAELIRLRKLVLEKGEARAAAESRVSSLELMIGKRDDTIRQQIETISQYESRLEIKRERIEALTGDVGSYKTTIEAKSAELTAVRKSRDRCRLICRRLIAALCATVALLAAVCVYSVWEVSNIDKGRTAYYLEEYLEEYVEEHFNQ